MDILALFLTLSNLFGWVTGLKHKIQLDFNQIQSAIFTEGFIAQERIGDRKAQISIIGNACSFHPTLVNFHIFYSSNRGQLGNPVNPTELCCTGIEFQRGSCKQNQVSVHPISTPPIMSYHVALGTLHHRNCSENSNPTEFNVSLNIPESGYPYILIALCPRPIQKTLFNAELSFFSAHGFLPSKLHLIVTLLVIAVCIYGFVLFSYCIQLRNKQNVHNLHLYMLCIAIVGLLESYLYLVLLRHLNKTGCTDCVEAVALLAFVALFGGTKEALLRLCIFYITFSTTNSPNTVLHIIAARVFKINSNRSLLLTKSAIVALVLCYTISSILSQFFHVQSITGVNFSTIEQIPPFNESATYFTAVSKPFDRSVWDFIIMILDAIFVIIATLHLSRVYCDLEALDRTLVCSLLYRTGVLIIALLVTVFVFGLIQILVDLGFWSISPTWKALVQGAGASGGSSGYWIIASAIGIASLIWIWRPSPIWNENWLAQELHDENSEVCDIESEVEGDQRTEQESIELPTLNSENMRDQPNLKFEEKDKLTNLNTRIFEPRKKINWKSCFSSQESEPKNKSTYALRRGSSNISAMSTDELLSKSDTLSAQSSPTNRNEDTGS